MTLHVGVHLGLLSAQNIYEGRVVTFTPAMSFHATIAQLVAVVFMAAALVPVFAYTSIEVSTNPIPIHLSPLATSD